MFPYRPGDEDGRRIVSRAAHVPDIPAPALRTAQIGTALTTVLDQTAPIDIQPAAAGLNESIVPEVLAPASAAQELTVEEESGFNDAGLGDLTGQDWLFAAVWGIAGAVATTAMAVLFVPTHLMALTFVLGAGLGMLGYLDHCTQLIRNTHTVVFGSASALLLVATQIISPASSILIPAVIAAAVSLAFMTVLARCTQSPTVGTSSSRPSRRPCWRPSHRSRPCCG